jgi:hypothetical protein
MKVFIADKPRRLKNKRKANLISKILKEIKV